MPLEVRVNGATKDAVGADVRIAGATKRATRIEAWNGSAWKSVQVFSPSLTLSIDPPSATGGRDTVPGTVTTNAVTATPAGGTGPFSYAWSRVSGTEVTVTSPTFASTTFRYLFVEGGSVSAVYRCDVTDSLGETASATVNILLINTGTGA